MKVCRAISRSLSSASIISFDRKPFSGGMPASDSAAMVPMAKVIGISLRSPPSRLMERVPVSWSMMPAVMNSDALKVAWLMMWKTAAIAASSVPKPSSIVIRPSWLTVEWASSAFRSSLNTAITAPTVIVISPVVATIQNHSSVPASTGHSRAIRNSPAFTIVAL